jgi:hypothetical protein
MAPKSREPHSIIYRYVTRAGRTGAPESHRENLVCQERHLTKFINDGWKVLIRESEIDPLDPIEPAQSNPRREDDGA